MTDQDAHHGQRRAEWHIVLGAIVLIGVGWFGWKTVRVATAPSTEEAMRLSLAELDLPELSAAYALHPDSCTISKTLWKWSVSCEGVPIYFYRDLRQCDPGPPRTCRTVPSDARVCVSYFWDIGLNGRPSNPIGDHGNHASIGDGSCNAKGTFASEREVMARRGIAPNLVEVR
ncbi:hypothetical protein UP10_18445 [Bradyrhizobium sp. LTSPM299]|jgi:hypothetical protein|uniref:hypothetical protein n=1 Tax=Bradyrhizobium sp. LTSPM299 TaxID=1619233 RepID=UPI0005C99B4A|nr:hypothetical protein [Bradyrhizobium sp. LTSPM299]KJC59475.1 hypothetical protein UP10_18445 [Bradyrhizobium sp. LTSPM299]